MTKFLSAYDRAYNKASAPFVFLFSKGVLPKTFLFVFMTMLSISCHNSTPYTRDKNAEFIPADSLGYNTGLPATSSKQYEGSDVKPIPSSPMLGAALTSNDSVVVEDPKQYTKRALDSAKAIMIAKSRALTTPDPIAVTYDTIKATSPAEVPTKAKPLKSPAQKLAIAAKNPKGLPAVSYMGNDKIDNTVHEFKGRKPYDCKCLDKQAITKGSTAYSVVKAAKTVYPDMTLTRLAEINKPNVITKWQIGTNICFKRASK